MKRLLCLFLCLLMLFCIGCKKEEPELGTQYVSGQNTYNTHVRMALVTEIPREPLSSIVVEIQNDTDCHVNLLGKFDEWQCEKWDGGKWVKLPLAPLHDDLYTDRVTQQSAQRYKKYFAEPLEKGSYRLQHAVRLQPSDGEDFECMVEVYFTVTPNYDE